MPVPATHGLEAVAKTAAAAAVAAGAAVGATVGPTPVAPVSTVSDPVPVSFSEDEEGEDAISDEDCPSETSDQAVPV